LHNQLRQHHVLSSLSRGLTRFVGQSPLSHSPSSFHRLSHAPDIHPSFAMPPSFASLRARFGAYQKSFRSVPKLGQKCAKVGLVQKSVVRFSRGFQRFLATSSPTFALLKRVRAIAPKVDSKQNGQAQQKGR
jgi:hypothetical protein